WVEDLAGKSAYAVQMFKTTGKGMADAFGALGASGTASNISMDEQFAVLGMLQSTMSGGEAGTKFKAFLAGVGNAQKTLGLQFTDSAGNMLPVLDILDKLKVRYGETLSVAEGDELKKAFGSDEAVAMVKLLMTNTKGLGANINALANTHGMGKAEQMAAAMTDQWQRVEQAWFAVRAAAFGVLLPAINQVTGTVADGAAHVLRWTNLFPNMTKVISYAVLGVVGLSMVTGGWLLVAGLAKMATLGLGIAWSLITAPLGLLNAGLATFRAIMLAVNIAMYANPIGLIVAGVVLLGAAVAAAIYYWDDLKTSMADWSVFKLLGRAVDWLIDKLNMIPGVNIAAGGMPDLNLPNSANINAPLARYRAGGQSTIPAGGLGQQLIQANAAATTANQKPPKYLSIGEVHMHNQNPMTPEQLAENAWLETP
ncbi:MAG: phage tail tape measure protein, partial [Aeromonas veronii]